METINGQIFHPFSMIVTGASMSGKTEFVCQLLRERQNLINQPIKSIVWCYGQETRNLSRLQREFGDSIKLIKGLPGNITDILKKEASKGVILILDDLVDTALCSKQIFDLFVKGVHHLNVSVVCVLQDFYASGSYRVTMVRNTNYLVVFPSPIDQSLIDLIGRKVLPKQQKTFNDMFQHGTKTPYGYIFISGHPLSDRKLRFRTNIFGSYQTILTPT